MTETLYGGEEPDPIEKPKAKRKPKKNPKVEGEAPSKLFHPFQEISLLRKW